MTMHSSTIKLVRQQRNVNKAIDHEYLRSNYEKCQFINRIFKSTFIYDLWNRLLIERDNCCNFNDSP